MIFSPSQVSVLRTLRQPRLQRPETRANRPGREPLNRHNPSLGWMSRNSHQKRRKEPCLTKGNLAPNLFEQTQVLCPYFSTSQSQRPSLCTFLLPADRFLQEVQGLPTICSNTGPSRPNRAQSTKTVRNGRLVAREKFTMSMQVIYQPL